MSTIDQAFVKAFQKNRQAVDSTESSARSEETRAAALGMSTIWVDPSTEERWRPDEAHHQPHPPLINRSRGATRQRFARPIPPTNPADREPETTNDTPDRSEPLGPPPVAASDLPSVAADAIEKRIDGAAEATFDLNMFDAIDVTPAPFAILSQTRVVAEHSSTQSPIPLDRPTQADTDGNRSIPTSVPFVKIHQRVAADAEETDVDTESSNTESAIVEESASFEAAWEVDRFEQPPIVSRLLDEEGLVTDAVAPLVETCRGGLQTLVVTSAARQQGRTTLATGLALATARAGLRVALLDIDAEHPALADQLQLNVETGWTAAIRKGISLQESAIYSVADRLTLLPIIASSPRVVPTREEIVETLDMLRQSFDLIILDAAAIDMEAAMKTQLPANQLDSALVIRDRREANESGFEECVAALRQMGIVHIGVADNFVDCTS